MTDNELRKLAAYIVSEQSRSREWMTAYAQAQHKAAAESIYITLKEAAMLIGKSTSWLYKHKACFTCEKSGSSQSSVIVFDKTVLLDEYAAYLRRERSSARMEPLWKVM